MPSTDANFNSWSAANLSLEGERLTDQIAFGEHGTVSFHWSDFRDACRLWQTRIAIEPALRQDYEKRLQEMEKLRRLPIWIRSGQTTTQTNLYDLYEGFICDQLWHGEDILPHPLYDISLISPSGPFKQMSVTNCFNLQTYRDFVMVFLLQDKLPRRDFRLRVKSKILAEYGRHFSEACLIELEQISATGLLFKIPGAQFFSHMRDHDQVRVLFKTDFLTAFTPVADFRKTISEWNGNPFYTHDKSAVFTFNSHDVHTNARFDGDVTKDCFVMVSFAQMATTNAPMVQRLQLFVGTAQKTILDMLKTKHAA